MLEGILDYISNKQPVTFVLENVPRLKGRKHRRLTEPVFCSVSRFWWGLVLSHHQVEESIWTCSEAETALHLRMPLWDKAANEVQIVGHEATGYVLEPRTQEGKVSQQLGCKRFCIDSTHLEFEL